MRHTTAPRKGAEARFPQRASLCLEALMCVTIMELGPVVMQSRRAFVAAMCPKVCPCPAMTRRIERHAR